MKKDTKHKIFNIKKLPMDVGKIMYYGYGLFTRIKVVKCEGYQKVRDGAILVANHRSFSDPATVGAAFPFRRVHFMTSKEVMGKGLRTVLLKGIGCVSLDREIFDLECIKKCLKILEKGYYLGIFPQGGIVREDKVDALKSGALLLACKAGVPVVPMYIKKKKHFYSRQKIYVGMPVDYSKMQKGKVATGAELDAFTKDLRERMKECETRAKELWGDDQ